LSRKRSVTKTANIPRLIQKLAVREYICTSLFILEVRLGTARGGHIGKVDAKPPLTEIGSA